VATSAGAATPSSETPVSAVAVTPLPPPRVETLPPVVKAAKAINAFLQSDANFPDIDSYCKRKAKPGVHEL
jgi:nuclear pore complex protein Nup155